MKRYVACASLVAMIYVAGPAARGAILAVDINDRATVPGANDNPDTAPGFSPFVMSASPTSALQSSVIGAYTVGLIAFDDGEDENTVTAGIQNSVGQIDDRDRADIPNSGAFTYGQLYDDLVFAGTSVGPTGGMNLTVGGLSPNTQYFVSLYAFDSGSTAAPQPRTAQWLDGNNSNALVTTTSFGGGVNPTANNSYMFSGLAVTDANGQLLLLGRNTTPNSASGATNIGVFLNGFEINAAPEPAGLSLLLPLAAAVGRRRHSAN